MRGPKFLLVLGSFGNAALSSLVWTLLDEPHSQSHHKSRSSLQSKDGDSHSLLVKSFIIMAHTAGLGNLPFDILYGIATTLDDRDFIHLSRTNRALHESLQSDQIARKTVEVLHFDLSSQLESTRLIHP